MKLSHDKISDDEKNSYNIWVEHKDPEYHVLEQYVDAYKSGNASEMERTCNILSSYDINMKAELVDLFDAKINRLISRDRISESDYYMEMKKHFVNNILWKYNNN
jgi:hypothetical protein